MRDLRYEYIASLGRWDIVLTTGTPQLQTVTDLDELGQRILRYWRTFENEWFLDYDMGMPYYTEILGKGRDLDEIGQVIREKTAALDEVEAVDNVQVTLVNSTRQLTVTCRIRTIYGTTEIAGSIL